MIFGFPELNFYTGTIFGSLNMNCLTDFKA